MKRLGIYFFYDENGIVDDYIPYFLKHLKEQCSELCVVVNGALDDKNKNKISKYVDNLLLRENKGFDSWAYKYAIEHYGYYKIKKEYDELLLCNYTAFGPIYPFSEMFDKMSKMNCDFWGSNKHCAYPGRFGGIKIIPHIQSYFINFKKSILTSKFFKSYWETLNNITNYQEAVGYHELRCTKYFEDLGFKSAHYIEFDKYEKLYPTKNASVYCADMQLIDERASLLKRKVFYLNERGFNWQTKAINQLQLLEYIQKNTDYPIRLIIQNIARENEDILKLAYMEYKKHKIKKFFLNIYKILSKLIFWKKDYFNKKTKETYDCMISKNNLLQIFDFFKNNS